MKTTAGDEETESRVPIVEKAIWIPPEVSEPKELIGYPDGLILQGGSGDLS